MKLEELKQLIREAISQINEEANEALASDAEVENFIKMLPSMSQEQAVEKLTALLKKHAGLLNSVLRDFIKSINSAIPTEIKSTKGAYKFLYQLKSEESIVDKVIARGKSLLTIPDLVRGALLFKDGDQIESFIEKFKKIPGVNIKEIDHKTIRSDKKFGYYGPYHIILQYQGIDVELQVMPAKLWKYKEVAHGIYNDWRSKPGPIPKRELNVSKTLFKRGNTPNKKIDKTVYTRKQKHRNRVEEIVKELYELYVK